MKPPSKLSTPFFHLGCAKLSPFVATGPETEGRQTNAFSRQSSRSGRACRNTRRRRFQQQARCCRWGVIRLPTAFCRSPLTSLARAEVVCRPSSITRHSTDAGDGSCGRGWLAGSRSPYCEDIRTPRWARRKGFDPSGSSPLLDGEVQGSADERRGHRRHRSRRAGDAVARGAGCRAAASARRIRDEFGCRPRRIP